MLLRPRMLALHCLIWVWKIMWVRIYQVHTLYSGLDMWALLHLALLCPGHCPFSQMKDAVVLKDSEHHNLCRDCSYNSIIEWNRPKDPGLWVIDHFLLRWHIFKVMKILKDCYNANWTSKIHNYIFPRFIFNTICFKLLLFIFLILVVHAVHWTQSLSMLDKFHTN